MALKKQIDTKFGCKSEYWRIIRINECFDGGVEVFVGGYKDSTARQNQSLPLEIVEFKFYETDVTRSVAYGLIKSNPMFNDAEDI